MKKIVLFIVASLLCSCLSPFAFAQSESAEEILSKKIGTDGLMLAMKQSDAIFEIGKMGNFTLTDRCEHPQGGELLYYLNQKQKIAYVICVNTQGLIWGIEKQIFVNENYVESTFKSKLFGILYPMVSLDTLMRMLIFNQKIETAIRLWKAKYGVGK